MKKWFEKKTNKDKELAEATMLMLAPLLPGLEMLGKAFDLALMLATDRQRLKRAYWGFVKKHVVAEYEPPEESEK